MFLLILVCCLISAIVLLFKLLKCLKIVSSIIYIYIVLECINLYFFFINIKPFPADLSAVY